LPDDFINHATDTTNVSEKNSITELDSLKAEEEQLLNEKRQLLESAREFADKLQSEFDNIAERKSRLLEEMEKNSSSKQPKNKNESNYKLFSIETYGSAWNDRLVFTVMAENNVWAEEIVREWLNSHGRENHRIDKVRGLISRDVRAVVNVGALIPTI
jgi:hypothetical protein